MLKTLIKRNGQEEAYDPMKLIRWSQWAAKHLGNRVDWAKIVRKASEQLDVVSTTQRLQDILIELCNQEGSYAYSRMGGRLFAAKRHKELYNDKIPSIQALHEKLVDIGLMEELGYTENEYAFLENHIVHHRDFEVTQFQLDQIRNKYSLKNLITGEEYESAQFVFMRMAMAVFSKEKNDKLNHVVNFYHHLSLNQINAPSPNYINLGTPHRGLASCCLYVTDDTAASIAAGNHIAETMTYMSAGIGGAMLVRSITDPVRGGRIVHQGKLPYYKATAGVVKSNMQAGRGGALTSYYSGFDPEAPVIAFLQNPRAPDKKKNRDMHFAMMGNSFMAKLAAEGAEMMQFNCYTAPELWKALFSPDIKKFEQLYREREADTSIKKTYVNATRFIRDAMQQSYEVGTHYMAFMDEINRHTPFKEPIHCSNLCVAPETMLLTDKGHFPIVSLVGQKVKVWNGEQYSEVEVVKTGENQELTTVRTSDGRSLDCTSYHKWYVQDEYHSKPREVRTHELQPGMKLIKFDVPVIEGTVELHKPYVNGFFTGDGTKLPNGQSKLYLYGPKKHLAPLFGESLQWRDYPNRLETEVIGLKEKFFVPTSNFTVQSRLDWLAGYLDADGSVYRNGTNEAFVASSVNLLFLEQLQYMLQTLGVNAKITKATGPKARMLPLNDGSGQYGSFDCQALYRLLITSGDSQRLLNLGLKTHRLTMEQRETQRDASHFSIVTEVENYGRSDDTYCVTEPLRHMAVFNGILTGQCLEIAEPTATFKNARELYDMHDNGFVIVEDFDGKIVKHGWSDRIELKNDDVSTRIGYAGEMRPGVDCNRIIDKRQTPEVALCSLGGLVLDNIKDDETHRSVAYYTLRMIDYCIDNAHYELPNIGWTAKLRRNAGVGTVGLATVLARKNLRYDTEEGLAEIHRISEDHMYFLIEASVRIAEERGPAPWIHKTKWPEGWLPIDTYRKSVDTITPNVLRRPWEPLRARVIKAGGIGHSCLAAEMPTESSSKAAGQPNGRYPVRSLALKKSDQSNVIDWVAPDNDLIGDQYQPAWSIKPLDMIKMYAVSQKFLDHSISADTYRDRSKDIFLSSHDLVQEYIDMARYGMKTRYYANVLTSSGGEVVDSSNKSNCGSGGCTL